MLRRSSLKWGVFDGREVWADDQVHIVPCDASGTPLPPHELSSTCSCGPRIEETRNQEIVVHNMIQ